MKTLYMTKGLPASGKTTAAQAMVASSPNTKRVNKDDLRAMMDAGRWSKDNEKFVLKMRDRIIIEALTLGQHVIVDDTNLAPKHEVTLRALAHLSANTRFEILDFTHVPVDECIKRDLARPNSVGPTRIMEFYDRYLRPAIVVAPAIDPALPDCVIVDIDGTIAKVNGRSHYDMTRVHEDRPRETVIDAVMGMLWPADKVLFVSGRDSCYDATYSWLTENIPALREAPGPIFRLFMRETGDTRDDTIVKREIYETHIKGKYNVRAIFDDRPKVIRMWRDLGFTDRIFDVGEGREF